MTDEKLKEAKDHLAKVRQLYLDATLEQRLIVIRDRLVSSGPGPKRLTIAVEVVEAFARALLLEIRAPMKGTCRDEAYTAVRRLNALNLLQLLEGELSEFSLSNREKEEFGIAADFRNVITHEGTSLRDGLTHALSRVAYHILRRLLDAAVRKGLVNGSDGDVALLCHELDGASAAQLPS